MERISEERIELPDPAALCPPVNERDMLNPRESNVDEIIQSMLASSDMDISNMIPPDNPVMERFQNSLHDQLFRRVFKLEDKVVPAIEEAYVNEEKYIRTNLLEAFIYQEKVAEIETILNKLLKEIRTTIYAADEMDYRVDAADLNLEAEIEAFDNAENEEIEVEQELTIVHLQTIEYNEEEEIRQYDYSEAEIQSLTIERNKQEHCLIKKEVEWELFGLVRDIVETDADITKTEREARVKGERSEMYADMIAMYDIEVDANHKECKAIVKAFHMVVVTEDHRDKYYDQFEEPLEKFHDKEEDYDAEMLNLDAAIPREHTKNYRYTQLKLDADYSYDVTKSLCPPVERKYEEKMKVFQQHDVIIEENEAQILECEERIEEIMHLNHLLDQKIERIQTKKEDAEKAILRILDKNEFINDLFFQKANMLSDLRNENNDLDIEVSELDWQTTNKTWNSMKWVKKGEKLDVVIAALTQTADEEEAVCKEIENEATDLEYVLSKMIILHETLQYEMASVPVEDTASDERMDRRYERVTTKSLKKEVRLMAIWNLMDFKATIEMMDDYQTTLEELDYYTKNWDMIHQRLYRINDKLAKFDRENEKQDELIELLEEQCEEDKYWLRDKRKSKEIREIAYDEYYDNIVERLEDAEFESMQTKAVIMEIEEDKLELARQMAELHRAGLAWETKLSMVTYSHQQIQETLSKSGDIETMKTEIHRMKVRYSELKLAQNKLLHDLDLCIVHRETVLRLAEARSRFYKQGLEQWRINFDDRIEKKCQDLSDSKTDEIKIAQLIVDKKNDIEEAKKRVNIAREELVEIAKVKPTIETSKFDVEMLHHLHLEILRHKHQKIRLRGKIHFGMMREKVRSDAVAYNAYVRERNLNSKLLTLVDDMITDLPSLVPFLIPLKNTLTVPALNL